MASVVFVKNPNGKTYAYENMSYWDKQSKKTKHKRRCIGHVDPDTGTVVSNHKKGARSVAATTNQSYRVRGIGVSLLLDHIAETTGLRRILEQVYGNHWQQILTCAYYLISEGSALSRAEQWTAANNTPYNKVLTSQRISELLIQLSTESQLVFFAKWIEHNQNSEYYALDITSVSSYSELIDFVRYGYNRDKDKLPQVNVLMVSGETSHLPLLFRVIPGSIKDVSTLTETLDTLELINARRLHLVMDKGFYSEANIDAMYSKHIRFMIGVPFSTGYAKNLVKLAREEGIRSAENFKMIFDDEVYVKTELGKWNGHRCYAHIFFDSMKAEIENRKLDRLLNTCFKELATETTIKAHKSYYDKFFHINETPKRGRTISYNQTAIDNHRENTTGWFVMITNDVKDPIKALEIYRQKDTVEKAFDDLKNDLDCKRLRIHSTQAMDGRLFIQFIALILATKVKAIMNEADWYRVYDMQQVIDEIKSLREVKMEGSRKRIVPTPTAFQGKIIQLFGLQV